MSRRWLRFFNTSAFAVPATNAFGFPRVATRSLVQARRQVERRVSRDVRLSGAISVVSIQLQGDQSVQRRAVWRDRFGRELADVRAGRLDSPHAEPFSSA